MSDLQNTVVTVTEETTQVVTVGIQGPRGAGYTSAPYIDFDKILDPPTLEGRLAWDPVSGTLRLGMPGGNVNLQLGQEQLARVRNKSGATILNGSLVYVSGATGQTPEVLLASASNYDKSIRTIAMATEDIANNSIGFVTTFGIVRDLSTNGIAEGAVVYLVENGGFSATPPAYPSNRVAIGICIYEHPNSGQIFFFAKFIFRKFGDPSTGHYTGFDDLGRLINYGSARTWNDLPPIPLLNQRTGGANQPSLATFLGNIQQLTFAIGDYVYGNYEIMHEYCEGTNIEPHIHFATNSLDTSDRYVKWELEYTIANADAVAPFSEVFPTPTVITAETLIPANTPAKAHILNGTFPAITGTTFKIGAYILWRLRRIAGTGTAPSANPFGITLGFHVLQDSQGSDTIGVKNIS